MNLVDSSAWLEYLADGPNAGDFHAPITDAHNLLVPTIALYEVFKRLLVLRDEEQALRAMAYMRRGTAVELDAELALDAAQTSVKSGLPMADSIILATASRHGAIIWTQDADFSGIEGVKYFARRA